MRQLPHQTLQDAIKRFLPHIPPYGVFKVTTIVDLAPDSTTIANDIIEKEEVTLIMKYLEGDGFAVYRYDIKEGANKYAQLTDRGRELKECGSIEAFYADVAEYQKKEVRRITRDANLYWIQFWISVGAIAAAIYYSLEILRIQYHLGLPYHVFFQ